MNKKELYELELEKLKQKLNNVLNRDMDEDAKSKLISSINVEIENKQNQIANLYSDNNYMIHATDFFPHNKTILTNYDGQKKSDMDGKICKYGDTTKKINSFSHRQTVHFVENAVVESTSMGELEVNSRKFIIVEPEKYHINQIVDTSPNDLYTFGSVKLEEPLLIVREDCLKEIPQEEISNFKEIITYDGNMSKIPAILESKGIKLRKNYYKNDPTHDKSFYGDLENVLGNREINLNFILDKNTDLRQPINLNLEELIKFYELSSSSMSFPGEAGNVNFEAATKRTTIYINELENFYSKINSEIPIDFINFVLNNGISKTGEEYRIAADSEIYDKFIELTKKIAKGEDINQDIEQITKNTKPIYNDYLVGIISQTLSKFQNDLDDQEKIEEIEEIIKKINGDNNSYSINEDKILEIYEKNTKEKINFYQQYETSFLNLLEPGEKFPEEELIKFNNNHKKKFKKENIYKQIIEEKQKKEEQNNQNEKNKFKKYILEAEEKINLFTKKLLENRDFINELEHREYSELINKDQEIIKEAKSINGIDDIVRIRNINEKLKSIAPAIESNLFVIDTQRKKYEQIQKAIEDSEKKVNEISDEYTKKRIKEEIEKIKNEDKQDLINRVSSTNEGYSIRAIDIINEEINATIEEEKKKIKVETKPEMTQERKQEKEAKKEEKVQMTPAEKQIYPIIKTKQELKNKQQELENKGLTKTFSNSHSMGNVNIKLLSILLIVLIIIIVILLFKGVI